MPDVDAVVTATTEFINAEVLPIEDRFGGDFTAAGGDDLRRRPAGHCPRCGDPQPACTGRVRRTRSRDGRAGTGVRGCWLFAVRPCRCQYRSPRRGKRAPACTRRDGRSKASSTCVRWSPRPGEIGVRDDRACSRCRLRPERPRRRKRPRPPGAGASPARNGSSLARTVRVSSSSWPGRSGAPGDLGGATMFLSPAGRPGHQGRSAYRRPSIGPVSADIARSILMTCSCLTPRCWVMLTMASAMPRSGSAPPG